MDNSYKVTTVTKDACWKGFQQRNSCDVLTFLNRIDAALHIEILLGHIVMFAFQNFFETADGLCNGHVLPFETGKNLFHVKWLA